MNPVYFPILEISTVIGCRMMCKVCPQSVHIRAAAARHIEHSLTLETFWRCIKNVPREVEIDFAGMAEPWLNKQATVMVESAVSFGHPVAIYSTLEGMSLNDVARLSKLSLRTTLCVHLPDAHGIMKLDVDDGYLAVLEAVVEMIPCHFTLFGELHPKVRLALGARAAGIRDDSNGTFSRAGTLRKIERKTGALMCSACGPKIDHNVMLPNGDVVLCCQLYDLKHIIGNLKTMKYEELFHSPEYLKVMAGLAGDESIDIACRTCELAVSV